MKIMRTKSLLSVCAVLVLPYFLDFSAVGTTTISGWVPYWDITNSVTNLKSTYKGVITEANPFVYAFDNRDTIINTCKDQSAYKKALLQLKAANIKIIPTITNDIMNVKGGHTLKDSELVHRLIVDSPARTRHIQQIIKIVDEIEADGIDIDYEDMLTQDRLAFSQFIKELADALHSRNKTLSVTVQHKTREHWRPGAGAINWKQIAQYADKIIIMCYNYSSKVSGPGPICPPFWLKQIIAFARSQIPREKICLALALHGYDWSKGVTVAVYQSKAEGLIKKHAAAIQWDKSSQTPHFTYWLNGGAHKVWFENNQSIAAKLRLIQRYKIPHIALWHVGILSEGLKEELAGFLKNEEI